MLWKIILSLFCSHKKVRFIKNILTIEKAQELGYRSLWICIRCETLIPDGSLKLPDEPNIWVRIE